MCRRQIAPPPVDQSQARDSHGCLTVCFVCGEWVVTSRKYIRYRCFGVRCTLRPRAGDGLLDCTSSRTCGSVGAHDPRAGDIPHILHPGGTRR
jgi:hypothetical protein